MTDELMHYGIPHAGAMPHSGRYPWGSGDDPYQSSKSFLSEVDDLKKKGLSEKEIAEGFGMSIRELRAKKSIALSQKRQAEQAMAVRLKEKGYSNVAIGERMGLNESSVRALLDPAAQDRAAKVFATADMLRENVDAMKYVDVGVGTENHIGVSRTKLMASVDILKEEGYEVKKIQTPQIGTDKKTVVMVLAKPGTETREIYENMDKIGVITDRSEDQGKTFQKIEKPVSISSDRVQIRYAEEGGVEKDGVIELRRGVEDLSLGNARYAQVRIAVDGTHYLKGMAMYSDDIPDGVDIVFNTNKHQGTEKMKVLKEMKTDPENPFGATIKLDDELILAQRHYIGSDGKKHLSALNIVNEEGNWGEWKKALASQVLSKQYPALAKKQLGEAFDDKMDEFNEIMSLTNPLVKKKLLESFADDCDSSAVHLKAAALPRQGSFIILPFPDMSPDEIYAPKYRDGEQVALIRYPHGGTFEIPVLTVNNKHKTANRLIHNAIDAVGINAKVAEQLSGADFDGDTVLVIPTTGIKLKTAKDVKPSSPLLALKDFDPKGQYSLPEGAPKTMSARTKGIEMGKISNLITDMTLAGADDYEIAAAVRHSMVVIDAEKHNLNWKQSYNDNNIAHLHEKYQGRANAGASTLISKAKAEYRIPERKEGKLITDPETGKTRRLFVDPGTGEKLYEQTGGTYTKRWAKKDGEWIEIPPEKQKTIKKLTKSTQMYEAKDAFELSSGTIMETIYATHANKLKALANRARKASIEVELTPYSPSAAKTYSEEVLSLKAKLDIAVKNAPLERKAQLLANTTVKLKKEANPEMDAEEIKKAKNQALRVARMRTGAGKTRIKITQNEWTAIQSGAISNNFLSQILNNTDLDVVKQYAMPKNYKIMSSAKIARARAMLNNGATQAEVADALGVSISTIERALK